MIGFREYKKAFLDTRKILNRVERARVSAYTRPAGRIRLVAKQSIKDLGKIPHQDLFQLAVHLGMAQTTQDYKNLNREQWFGIVKMAGKGFHAPPGHAPYSHIGLLKRLIEYGFDKGRKAMLIGPRKIPGGTGAPEVLEKGGNTYHTILKRPTRLKPRPYMVPALKKAIAGNTIAKGWKGTVVE